MKNEKEISRTLQKKIIQEANSQCPFCGEKDVCTHQIHHIKSRADGGGNTIGNLILVCANCHTKITKGLISEADVLRKKIMLLSGKDEEKPLANPTNIISLEESLNTGIIANTINYKSPKKPPIKMHPPEDTIAADRDKRNYTKYLIDRYHEFKKADKTVKKLNYAMFYESIKRKFGCKWDFVPVEKFEYLAQYIQNRIDGTILGKINMKRGYHNYSCFDEYLAGQLK